MSYVLIVFEFCLFCFFPILLYLRTEVKVLISCSSDVSNPVSIRQLNERSYFWSLIAGSERIEAVLILRRGAVTKSYKETRSKRKKEKKKLLCLWIFLTQWSL